MLNALLFSKELTHAPPPPGRRRISFFPLNQQRLVGKISKIKNNNLQIFKFSLFSNILHLPCTRGIRRERTLDPTSVGAAGTFQLFPLLLLLFESHAFLLRDAGFGLLVLAAQLLLGDEEAD